LLTARVVVLLDMATPEETMTSANNQDNERGSDSSLAAFVSNEFMAYLSDDITPSTSSAHPPKDNNSACPAVRGERDDGCEEEKLELIDDDEAPRLPEMVAAVFEEAKLELIDDNEYAQVPPEQIVALFKWHSNEEEEHAIPPSTSSARPPEDKDSACPAVHGERDDGYKEEKLELIDDDESPRLPEMVVAAFEQAF
jgi:hypothetical protein